MTVVLCAGYLCPACCHPRSHHTALGCSELLDLGDDGYPAVCDCRRRGWDDELAPAAAPGSASRAREGEG